MSWPVAWPVGLRGVAQTGWLSGVGMAIWVATHDPSHEVRV